MVGRQDAAVKPVDVCVTVPSGVFAALASRGNLAIGAVRGEAETKR